MVECVGERESKGWIFYHPVGLCIEYCHGSWKLESDQVCHVHDVSIWLEALLDGKRECLGSALQLLGCLCVAQT